MRARLTAYAGVQLRDFLIGRVPLLVLATSVVAWAVFRVTGVTLAAFDPSAGLGGRAEAARAFEDALGVYAVVAAVFAAQGLVARDRWRGFDRILFSHPMSPVRYYGQGFVVAGVAAVSLGVVAAGVFSVAVRPVSVVGVAGYVGLAWLTVGALAVAVSAVTSYYLPVLLALLAAAEVLDRFAHGLRASGPTAASVGLEWAQYLLPPIHVLAALREPFARGRVVAVSELAWPLAFGLCAVVLAVLVLSRRPFRS